ncbi:MAG: hypothetical protein H5T84_07135, partial [Thermoleophilia bacterium]|nr:hypothetical protein [Thermoleophilia bacterium]
MVLVLLALSLSSVRSIAVWLIYGGFVLVYALWTLRLAKLYGHDFRLGYLLCLTDLTIILPVLVWNPGVFVRLLTSAVWAGGVVYTVAGARNTHMRAAALAEGSGSGSCRGSGNSSGRGFGAGCGKSSTRDSSRGAGATVSFVAPDRTTRDNARGEVWTYRESSRITAIAAVHSPTDSLEA